MTTLITGGNSKTGSALAKLLSQSGHAVLFASRSGKVPDGYESVKFDWYDASTFENPFKFVSSKGGDQKLTSAYLLEPSMDLKADKVVIPFINLAVEKGITKFVFLSGSNVTPDQVKIGRGKAVIQAHLEGLSGIDYVVLKPNAFMESFATQYVWDIKGKNQITNSLPTGRAPFVAIADVAQAAFQAITNSKPAEVKDIFVIGPDYLNFEEATTILSEELGRTIKHNVVSYDEVMQGLKFAGIPDAYREVLGEHFKEFEAGNEERFKEINEDGKIFVGKVTFREWVKANKAIFEVPGGN